MRRPRLLIAQPSLQPPGGGNAVAVWLIEALKTVYDVTVYAREPIGFEAVNRYVGSSLQAEEIEVRLLPRAFEMTRRALHVEAALWQRYVLLRYVRRVADEFDLIISVNNEIDVGRRAIQYVHFPWGWWPRPDQDLRWYHRIPGMLPLYYWIGDRLAPVSRDRISQNRTLVNSDWTAAQFRKVYGGDTTTVYPPIALEPNRTPTAERENAFVVLGMIMPHKEIETAVAVVDRLRRSGHDVRLRIVGGKRDGGYLRTIRRLADAHRDWITMHVDPSRTEVLALLGRSRYGMHATPDEHFGMAPAEMARSGCIVFVRDSGGQVEVVGSDPRLTWSSVDDAVSKISTVLADDSLQRDLHEHLIALSERFSYERFRDQVRAIVDAELSASRPS